MSNSEQLVRENTERYRSYIKKKFSIKPGIDILPFVLLDVYETFISTYNNPDLIFKGAFNLFLNFSFIRKNATRDMDFSIVVDDIDEIAKQLVNALNSLNNETCEIYDAFVEDKPLVLPRSENNGRSIKFKINIKNTYISDLVGYIDLTEEELPNSKFIISNSTHKSYSLERSFMDKLVTCICNGPFNTRTWDAEDMIMMYPKISIDEFFIDELYILFQKYQITDEELEYFKSNHLNIAKILKHPEVDSIFVEIIKILKL